MQHSRSLIFTAIASCYPPILVTYMSCPLLDKFVTFSIAGDVDDDGVPLLSGAAAPSMRTSLRRTVQSLEEVAIRLQSTGFT